MRNFFKVNQSQPKSITQVNHSSKSLKLLTKVNLYNSIYISNSYKSLIQVNSFDSFTSTHSSQLFRLNQVIYSGQFIQVNIKFTSNYNYQTVKVEIHNKDYFVLITHFVLFFTVWRENYPKKIKNCLSWVRVSIQVTLNYLTWVSINIPVHKTYYT